MLRGFAPALDSAGSSRSLELDGRIGNMRAHASYALRLCAGSFGTGAYSYRALSNVLIQHIEQVVRDLLTFLFGIEAPAVVVFEHLQDALFECLRALHIARLV